VALVAFTARLLPVLRSSGLRAIHQYDASVYFGSSVGLVHGRLPYRDFLLLHPPGLPVALTPFAALTYVTSDGNAMVAARLAWMGLGAANAVLVAVILRRLGRLPAAFGALCYAVSYPAVTIEQTTRLEGLAATCLLAGVALLTGRGAERRVSGRWLVLAGLFLGFSTTIKVWQVVPVLVVVAALLVTAGWRRAAALLGVAVATATAVCLPFFLAAPGAMWRYVVTDQLGRASAGTSLTTRLADITGVGLAEDQLGAMLPAAVAAAALVLLAAAALARVAADARLSVALMAVLTVLLLFIPGWLPHYAGLVAAPAAVVLGAATRPLLDAARRAGRAGVTALVAVLAAGLIVAGAALTRVEFARPFQPGAARAVVAGLPGCITADDPGTLVELDVLSRNLERGCPLSLDLGGYSYEFNAERSSDVRREKDERWQRHALDYLGSGSAAIVTRYSTGFGFSRATAATIRSWPVLASAGRYKLRQPPR
jgi:hypothetical protein